MVKGVRAVLGEGEIDESVDNGDEFLVSETARRVLLLVVRGTLLEGRRDRMGHQWKVAKELMSSKVGEDDIW